MIISISEGNVKPENIRRSWATNAEKRRSWANTGAGPDPVKMTGLELEKSQAMPGVAVIRG
ncbi:MAG: hypothetical protein DRH37_10795 [Deltaproteobacteria bacterium]|nr:MAG: hypothetical protein DRH37_10795 [Deltaproteobacteria bacterium]